MVRIRGARSCGEPGSFGSSHRRRISGNEQAEVAVNVLAHVFPLDAPIRRSAWRVVRSAGGRAWGRAPEVRFDTRVIAADALIVRSNRIASVSTPRAVTFAPLAPPSTARGGTSNSSGPIDDARGIADDELTVWFDAREIAGDFTVPDGRRSP